MTTLHERTDTPAAFDRLVERLRAARKVVIFTHQRPDPDALGSQAAAALVLQRIGAAVTIVNFDPVAPQYRMLQDGLDGMAVVDFAAAAPGLENDCDTFLCVDTCSYQQMEPARTLLERQKDKVVAIDHHVSRDEIGPVLYTDTRAAACVELVSRVRKILNVPLDVPLAERLLAGLVADTGWFRFDNVTSATFALASVLVAAGAQPAALYQKLMQNETPSKLALTQRALASVQWDAGYRFACMVLTPRDFQETGATQSQTEYLVDLPMQVGTAEVAAILTEMPDGRVRASLRSKCRVNVSAICNTFGGGGHVRAAGCRLEGPLAQARARIAAAVERALVDDVKSA